MQYVEFIGGPLDGRQVIGACGDCGPVIGYQRVMEMALHDVGRGPEPHTHIYERAIDAGGEVTYIYRGVRGAC